MISSAERTHTAVDMGVGSLVFPLGPSPIGYQLIKCCAMTMCYSIWVYVCMYVCWSCSAARVLELVTPFPMQRTDTREGNELPPLLLADA